MSYILKPYTPLIKIKSFDPSPVAGKIPYFADGENNPQAIGSSAYNEFWEEQIDRCMNGYRTGGIDISGRFYFYLNFVVINGLFGPQYPWYTDLDLDFFNLVEDVKRKGRMGLVCIKARRKGLSEKTESILQHGVRFTEGYRGAVIAGRETYVVGLKNKFINAHNSFGSEFRLNTLTSNDKQWKAGFEVKNEIGGFIEEGYKGLITFETMFDDPTKLEGEYFHDVIAEESGQNKILGKSVDSIRPALEFGSQMMGSFYLYGCVCAGTKVWNNKGDLINVEDLQQSEGILGFDGNKVSKEDITYMQPSAEKECYRITTKSGTTLECSYDHPILWANKGYLTGPRKNKRKSTKFVEAKDFKIGDQVAVIESVPIYGKKKMWKPRVVGWLIGDGSYGFDRTPVMSNCDIEINNYILKNLDSVIEKSYFTKEFKIYHEIRIRKICPILREIGIYGQTKRKKRLPLDIQSYRKKDICELLGGLFDTDGHVNAKKGGYRITLTSMAFDMLFDTKLLLQKLGIHSSITTIQPSKSSLKGGSVYYRLEVRDKRSVICFGENIKFKIKYKQQKLEFIINWFNNIPIAIRKGKPVIMNKGVPGLRFERVVSIENIGMKRIYNLTAGKTNTYIANGIVTHNTGGNILSGSKDFKDYFDNADIYDLDRLWISGSRFYFPFFGNNKATSFVDKDTGETIDGMPNFKHLKPYERLGIEDIDAATDYIKKKTDEYSKLPNKTKLIKWKQSYPLSVEDAFTSSGNNNFNSDLLYSQIFYIDDNKHLIKPYILEYVREKQDDGSFRNKIPLQVTARPAKPSDPDWQVVFIYQHPQTEYKNLDVAGIDGYNQDQTQTSKSLGAMVVLRNGRDIPEAKDIHNGIYPVALYYKRPPRKEQFYERSMMISIYYNLIGDTMISAESDLVIDYYIRNGGRKFLAQRPRSFDSPNSQMLNKYGAKMTGHSKPLMISLVQTMIEDFCEYIYFRLIIVDALAYDEENVGTDWDSIDAYGLASMRISDKRVKPRANDYNTHPETIKWVLDADGNPIPMGYDHDSNIQSVKIGESVGNWVSNIKEEEVKKSNNTNLSEGIFEASDEEFK